MTLINRFTTTTQGAMILTGNTLNCRQGNAYLPGVDYQNGSYIATNTTLIATTGFPHGTTFSPGLSSSSAIVNIPNGSTILYAQLFWTSYGVNVTSPDSAINFSTPQTATTLFQNLALKQ